LLILEDRDETQVKRRDTEEKQRRKGKREKGGKLRK